MAESSSPSRAKVDRLDETVFAALGEAARWAPSPDNNQPWAFRQVDDGVQVLHVRERAVSSDCRDLFSWLALGAAIENIVLRATTHGLRGEAEYRERPFPQIDGLEHVATVRLSPSDSVEPAPLATFIETRCTNRKPYKKKPPEREKLQRLEETVRESSVQVQWFTERSAIRDMARRVAVADRIRFEHQPFHEELHSVLRYTPEQVERTRDGLDVRTLELPGFMGRVLRWLRPWPRMRRLNRLGLSRAFAGMSAQQVKASGALAMLSTTDPTDRGYLEAGRAMQRFWLAAAAEGLATQPLGALPLFLLTAREAPESFGNERSQRMAAIASALDLPEGHQPVMIFRLGAAASPSERSIRYSPNAIA